MDTTTRNRTKRCSTCYGQGVMTMNSDAVPCTCSQGHGNPATRKTGMLGTKATGKGKHGARGRTGAGQLSRPCKGYSKAKQLTYATRLKAWRRSHAA